MYRRFDGALLVLRLRFLHPSPREETRARVQSSIDRFGTLNLARLSSRNRRERLLHLLSHRSCGDGDRLVITRLGLLSS
jgi:hypothetical protein